VASRYRTEFGHGAVVLGENEAFATMFDPGKIFTQMPRGFRGADFDRHA
jgi:hypothetical protein